VNTGTSILSDVTVIDRRVPGCSRTSSAIPALASLAPGASVRYTCSRTNVRAPFTNVVLAAGTGSAGTRVQATDSATVGVFTPPKPIQRATVLIVKGPASQSVAPGGTATFTITVKNTGKVAASGAAVVDTRSPGCSRRLGTLAPGQTMSYGCASRGVDASFANVARATWRSAGGRRGVVTSGVAGVVVTRGRPAIAIVKSPGVQKVSHGGAARFQITVRNTGNVTLHRVAVRDPLSPACNRTLGPLAPGRSVGYQCRSAPVTRGFTNTATVTALSPGGARVAAAGRARVELGPRATRPKYTG
jgi:uncharacterized repeat protein (TIGR01451 family)